MANKLKKGVEVVVIAGDHKGNKGKILEIIRDKNRVLIEGVNLVKKHNKPNAQNPQGGITEKEASIDISNLSVFTADGKTTRVGYRMEDGSKVRFAKKTDEVI